MLVQKSALTIDANGLRLRACQLAKREGDVLQADPLALSILARPEQAATVKKAIAAWNRSEQASALIYLVHLGEPAVKTEAQVRAALAKAGYDSSEARDNDGKWTDSGSGASAGSPQPQENTVSAQPIAYSSDQPGWHDYVAGPNIVCTATQSCSASEIADALSRYAVPGQDPNRPVTSGQSYPVHDPATGAFAGTVMTTIAKDGLTIVNTTNPGHIFYDGQIARMAIRASDGSWSVTTQGTGNNVIPGMNVLNQVMGPSIFNALDQGMAGRIKINHE